MAMQINPNGVYEPQFNTSAPWTVGYGKSGNVLTDSMSGPNGKKLLLVGRTAQALGQTPGTMMDWGGMSNSDKSAFASIAHQLDRESDTEKRKKLQKAIKVIAGTALAGGAIYFAAGAAAGGAGAAGGGGGAAAGTGATGAAGGGGAAAAGGGGGLAGSSSLGAGSLGLSSGATPVAGMGSVGFGGGAAGATAGGAGAAGMAAAGGGGAAAATAASPAASSGFWGAAKGVLGNKAIMSGIVTGLSSAYGQYQQKNAAKDAYKWQSKELEAQRAYQQELYERKQNSPAAKMSRALLQYYMPIYIEKLKKHNKGADTSALDQLLASMSGGV